MQCSGSEADVTNFSPFLDNFTLNLGTIAFNFTITLWRQTLGILFPSPDDTKIIKVTSSSLSAEWFFKGEDNTGHAVPVPDRPEDPVPKPATAAGYVLGWN